MAWPRAILEEMQSWLGLAILICLSVLMTNILNCQLSNASYQMSYGLTLQQSTQIMHNLFRPSIMIMHDNLLFLLS